MKGILAKTAGFCFGVEKAVNTVYEALESEGEKIYTYGPIIHNDIVVQELKDKGVSIVSSPEELKELDDGCLIIRSHGVSKEVYDILESKGIRYIDATCPFVLKIHRLVNEAAEPVLTEPSWSLTDTLLVDGVTVIVGVLTVPAGV